MALQSYPLGYVVPGIKLRQKMVSWWSSAGSWRALRHRQFFSLAELNVTISTLLTKLNDRAFRKLPRMPPRAL